MLFIILSMNFLLDLYSIDFYNFKFLSIYVYIRPIVLIIVSIFINGFLGIKFFKLIYKQEIQDSVVIILIVVFVDLVLESIFFYSTLILGALLP